jgi:AcrR family transcriptional regulator
MSKPSRARIVTRKRPKQERSEALYEAILAAAAAELVAKGYAQATTNRIAVAAGVSVGSLYQYFPSKDAIIVELMRRYRATRIAIVEEKLAPIDVEPLDTVVRSLFTALFHADARERDLLAVLVDHVARTEARREFVGYEESLSALVANALRRARTKIDVEDHDLAAHVMVRMVQALVHAAVTDAPKYDAKTIADEGTKLVLRYLGGDH